MNYPVKHYTSTMEGAPQLTNDWGCITALLDAVLVNGFNLKSISGITSAAGVATASITLGHLYQIGQVLLVAGADQPEYNGEVRVTATTATTFSYAITGSPISPATGASITSKVAPLGWEIAFTGINKRAYRSSNVTSNRPYLRVDDGKDPVYGATYAKKAKVTMAQGMSDVDTFVGARAPYNSAAPTMNEIGTGSGVTAVDGWYKWYYARVLGQATDSDPQGAGNRNWFLVGDDRGFYFLPAHNTNGGRAGYCFTDFESFRSVDGFNTLLCATDSYTAANAYYSGWGDYGDNDIANRFQRTLDYSGKTLMRDYIQIGDPVRAGFTSLNTNNGQTISGYSTGIPWPNGPDYSLLLHPVYLRQENGHMRGKIPGLFWVHNDKPLADLNTVTNVVGYPGKTFMVVDMAYSSASVRYVGSRVAFDITGPWW